MEVRVRLLAKGLSIVATVGVAAVLGATTTAATPAGGGWEPTSTPPFDNPAGSVCPFEIKGDIVYDKEYQRIAARFPDGTPRVEEFVGALGIRFTNVASGRSAVRDASGMLRITHHEDGGYDAEFLGNGATAIKTSNPSFPAGDYIVSGYFVLTVHPDRSREFTTQQGKIENMCQTLA
jgi:hypothetical protein